VLLLLKPNRLGSLRATRSVQNLSPDDGSDNHSGMVHLILFEYEPRIGCPSLEIAGEKRARLLTLAQVASSRSVEPLDKTISQDATLPDSSTSTRNPTVPVLSSLNARVG